MKASEDMSTIVVGINAMVGTNDNSVDWGVVMATTIVAMVVPVIVVVTLQKWFVKGLVDTEK